jgi:heptosyltransferase-2
VKVLIVAPAWVGDMVMAHSLVRTLTERTPGVTVEMLAPPATAPLAERMPDVAGVTILDVAHGELGLGKRRRVARQLAGRGYDQAIVLPNSFKSALVPFLAGIPRRTGWTGETRLLVLNDRRRLDRARYPLMIERFIALALDPDAPLPTPPPLPVLVADEARAQALRRSLELDVGNVTVLCPGAEFGPAKRWPEEHYAALARHLLEAGGGVWMLGSAGDADACARIETLVGAGGRLVNLAGRTTLLDALDLLALADRVVCNDSGLMHVAGALGRPVIALFGSTSPDFTPPLGPAATVLTNPVPCSPCFQRECPLGHFRCLAGLDPGRVIEVLR